jgi:polyisoprenoid-binding protein YceI
MFFRKTALLLTLALFMLGLAACETLAEPPTPSATLEAIPLEVATTAPTAEAPAEVEPTAASEETPAETPTEVPAEAPAAEPQVFTISAEQSEVRFELDEDLRAVRITVVGSTNQIAGQIALNPADLSTAQVGVIQINARTITTDNNFRNRAIQNDILETTSYELITFTPTAVNGLPAAAEVGQELTFTIDGQLTIKETTLPITFNVTASLVSDTQISGTASAVVNRTEFGLDIPDVPSVANVEEEVELYIDFVANQ